MKGQSTLTQQFRKKRQKTEQEQTIETSVNGESGLNQDSQDGDEIDEEECDIMSQIVLKGSKPENKENKDIDHERQDEEMERTQETFITQDNESDDDEISDDDDDIYDDDIFDDDDSDFKDLTKDEFQNFTQDFRLCTQEEDAFSNDGEKPVDLTQIVIQEDSDSEEQEKSQSQNIEESDEDMIEPLEIKKGSPPVDKKDNSCWYLQRGTGHVEFRQHMSYCIGEGFFNCGREGKIYLIERFKMENVQGGKNKKPKRRKVAICTVFYDLKHTFIGDEAKYITDTKWAKGRYEEKICLSDLDCRYKTTPSTDSFYNVSIKDSFGVGFFVIYSARSFNEDPVPITVKNRPKVLDLFSGGGGMSLGLKKAGFEIKYAVDISPSAAANFRVNHPGTMVFVEDVRIFLKKVKNKENAIYAKIKEETDHVNASPPCQGFSSMNRNGGKNDKANNDLTLFLVDAMKHMEADSFSMENVTGILRKKHRHYLQKLVAKMVGMGYQVLVEVLSAAHYKDPQDRQRVFVIAWASNAPMPEIAKSLVEKGNFMTVGEALQRFSTAKLEKGSGLVVLDNGDVTYNHNTDGTKMKASDKDVMILKANKPAGTISRLNKCKHPELDRYCTERELATLMGFPLDYEFIGTHRQKRAVIGNAVPVNMAKAVGETIIKTVYAVW